MAEGSTATGKAKVPHNYLRPTPKNVQKALDAGDIEELKKCLAVRQRRFAEEYVVDYNGTAACIRAGYKLSVAPNMAHVLKRAEGVQRYIDHLTQSKAAKLVSISPDYIIRELTSIISKEGVKDADKIRSLELLAKHLGMFIERTEISGKDGDAIRIDKAREDADDLSSAIAGLVERGRKGSLALVPNTGTEG